MRHLETSVTIAAKTVNRTRRNSASLKQKILDVLRADIIIGKIPPGEFLSEVHLAEKFNSSRTPVREACIYLYHEGFLRVAPYKGYVVTEVSVQGAQELYQVRAILEPAAAELAASNSLGPKFFSACNALLEKNLQIIREQRTYEGFKNQVATEGDLHCAIARASGNKMLEKFVCETMSRLLRFLYQCYRGSPWLETVVDEHKDILEAIRLQDGKRARQLMEEHLRLASTRASQIAITGKIA